MTINFDFELLLFVATCVTGIIALLCRYVIKVSPIDGGSKVSISELTPEPWYSDLARAFFPVFLIVFLLRGFVVEPFRIPSGSMLPTLEVGDFILVNKFHYGLRLPIVRQKITQGSSVRRGDIMVFRYPKDESQNYIKRIIGLPGDVIEYRDKRLFVNSEPVPWFHEGQYVAAPTNSSPNPSVQWLFQQTIAEDNQQNVGDAAEKTSFNVLIRPRRPSSYFRDEVPEGAYFAMGDNRDNSADSRVWGFVPEKNVVGKAFFVWFHYNGHKGQGFKFSRIGHSF